MARNRRYPSDTTIDADYADDLVPLERASIQAKFRLNSLE